jgi:hypothetical protein
MLCTTENTAMSRLRGLRGLMDGLNRDAFKSNAELMCPRSLPD